MTPTFDDGTVTLYARDFRDVLALLPSAPDLVVADPPYQQTALEWDRWPIGWPSLMPGRSLWCFGSLRMFLDRADEFTAGGWQMSQDVVWEKHNGSGFARDRFRRVHEQAVHFYRGKWADIYHVVPTTKSERTGSIKRRADIAHTGDIGPAHYEYGERLARSVIKAPSMHGRAINETQKPEELVRNLIEYGCPPGGLVFSPFAGSGTDLAAARALGRRAVGAELRPDQCAAAAERLSQGLLMVLS